MNSKAIGILILITGVLLAVTLMMIDKQETKHAPNEINGKFFPKLEDQINDITTIEVTQGDSKSVITLQSDVWQVDTRFGYPADFSKVKQAVLGVSGLEIIEPKTKNPEKYEKLGVESPSADSDNQLATFIDKDGKTLATVIIGESKLANAPGAKAKLYVRKMDDEQSWLVEGQVRLPSGDSDWLNTEIMDIDQKRMAKVAIAHPDKSVLTVFKAQPEDINFKVVDLAEDEELKFASAANTLGSALSTLILEDVEKSEGFTFDPETTTHSTLQTFDGLVINATHMEKDDKQFVKFSALFDESIIVKPPEKTPEEKAAEAESTTPDDAAKPVTKAPEEVNKEVAELNAKLSHWVYVIAMAKANNFTKLRSDIVKKKEPEKTEEEQASPAETAAPPVIDESKTIMPAIPAETAAPVAEQTKMAEPTPPAEESPVPTLTAPQPPVNETPAVPAETTTPPTVEKSSDGDTSTEQTEAVEATPPVEESPVLAPIEPQPPTDETPAAPAETTTPTAAEETNGGDTSTEQTQAVEPTPPVEESPVLTPIEPQPPADEAPAAPAETTAPTATEEPSDGNTTTEQPDAAEPEPPVEESPVPPQPTLDEAQAAPAETTAMLKTAPITKDLVPETAPALASEIAEIPGNSHPPATAANE